ncbi:MAG: hypothetical protein ACC682_11570 [Gemmatimonadota bacterium]
MDANVTEPAVNGAVLAARLTDVELCVPAPEIADVWLFPPLPDVVPSSEFVLFTRMLEGDTRALFSARMVPANGSPAHQVIVEHGSAPADLLPRLVSNLQRRLGQTTPARRITIDGQPDAWRRLVEEMRSGVAVT